MEKLVRVPPGWAKVHAGNQRALLAAEAAALAAIRRAVKAAHLETVEEIAQATSQPHVFATLQGGRARMAAAMTHAVTDARLGARATADERFQAELEQARKDAERRHELEAAGLIALLLGRGAPGARSTEDHTIASTIGDSFASAWSGAMLVVILKWRRESARTSDLLGRLRGIPEQTDGRVRRIGATETSRAYNDQHEADVRSLVPPSEPAPATPYRSPTNPPGPATAPPFAPGIMAGLFKRWDATLDRKTCAVCRSHDGEIVHAAGAFGGDDRPGDVHAFCRCLETLVFLPGRIGDA